MRLRLASAIIAIVVTVTATAASAADVPGGFGAGSYGNYPAYGGMEPVIV